ncbi:DUF5691 domain-containing protein [Methylocucumis oryzae]|uniref:Uncharacterized protein n=1 Tax=Methylocucumis oryzae TaxID=1632867 RepID=A0A0F3IGE9_9GAMM|nr:DUF5691 domain-containing protein [Methylocucumis oryzae]KJV05767.1 hypothetical protein VZ94_15720 [Methylocucumis oryzae]
MKIWQDLLKHAIVGSQHGTPLPPLTPAVLQQRQQHWQALSPERQVLNALALVSAYRAVGQTATSRVNELPPICPAESRAYISASLKARLQRYLQEQNHGLVQEALTLLVDKPDILTPDILAEFLAWCANNRADAAQVRAVIGQRGFWLCAQNPDWEHLLGLAADDYTAWQAAHGPARLSLFEQALQADFAQTLVQLPTVWPGENAKDRLALLEVLADHLNAEALSFLQSLHTDRSQAVREKATQCLAKLHDPDITALLLDTLKAMLSVHKPLLGKAQLHVRLPDELSETWKNHGIQEKLEYMPGINEKIGIKSGWLYQWLRLCDPLVLAKQLDVELKQLRDVAVQSEFANVLLNGLDAGAMLHGCAAWLPLRLASLKPKQHGEWLQKFSRVLPLADMESFMINHLKLLTPAESLAFLLGIAAHYGQLSKALALALIDALLASQTDANARYLYTAQSLAQLAFKLPLADYALINQRLQHSDNPHVLALQNTFFPTSRTASGVCP